MNGRMSLEERDALELEAMRNMFNDMSKEDLLESTMTLFEDATRLRRELDDVNGIIR